MDQYIHGLTKIFSEDGLDQYYIESHASKVLYDEEVEESREIAVDRVKIFETLIDWISSDKQNPVAILGGYGAGKSSLAKRLVSSLAKSALDNNANRIPVLIRLGQFSQAVGIEGIVASLFNMGVNARNINVPLFLDCTRRGRFLIICDGFDEMKHAMSWGDFRSTLSELNKLNEGDSKLLLLGRPNAFLSIDEHIQVFRGRRRFGENWRKLKNWPEFEEWELTPFDNSERSAFIKKYLTFLARGEDGENLDAQDIEERIEKVDALAATEPEIFAKPVHAQILTELSSEPTFDLENFQSGISRWDLYEAFFSFLAERESAKKARRPVSDNSRLDFLGELAFWLWSEKSGSTSFSSVEIPEAVLEQLKLEESDDLDVRTREYLVGAFLEKKLGDVFYFGHRSFAEFLVASRMLNVEPKGPEHGQYAQLLDGSVLDFFEEGLADRSLDSWAKTFDASRGTFDFEYCRFLARHCGNFRSLKKLLPHGSNASEILGCFSDSFDFGPVAEKKLCRLADGANATLYHMALATIDISLSKRHLRKKGIDWATLISVARLVVDNPVFSNRSFKSIRQGERYEIDGAKLRRTIEEELSSSGITIRESDGLIREEGWPDRFEVAASDLTSSDNFLHRGVFKFLQAAKIHR